MTSLKISHATEKNSGKRIYLDNQTCGHYNEKMVSITELFFVYNTKSVR